jgi:CheY-like chemotaxis protein
LNIDWHCILYQHTYKPIEQYEGAPVSASGIFFAMANADVAPEKRNPTILFVDDEPLSLKYFKASVGKYATVKTASSADAAMDILQSEGSDISIVVSDERMPRESGVSFLSDVRKSWPSTIRILTSAYANIDNLQHAINDAAIYRFVPKPWNLDELCAAMQDALLVERSANEVAEPAIGPISGGDAEEASLALLAILASGFDRSIPKRLNSASLATNHHCKQPPFRRPTCHRGLRGCGKPRSLLPPSRCGATSSTANHLRSLSRPWRAALPILPPFPRPLWPTRCGK